MSTYQATAQPNTVIRLRCRRSTRPRQHERTTVLVKSFWQLDYDSVTRSTRQWQPLNPDDVQLPNHISAFHRSHRTSTVLALYSRASRAIQPRNPPAFCDHGSRARPRRNVQDHCNWKV